MWDRLYAAALLKSRQREGFGIVLCEIMSCNVLHRSRMCQLLLNIWNCFYSPLVLCCCMQCYCLLIQYIMLDRSWNKCLLFAARAGMDSLHNEAGGCILTSHHKLFGMSFTGRVTCFTAGILCSVLQVISKSSALCNANYFKAVVK